MTKEFEAIAVDEEAQAINHCIFALNQLLRANDADAFASFARVFSYLRDRYVRDLELRQKDKDEAIAQVRKDFGEVQRIIAGLRDFTSEEMDAFIKNFRKDGIIVETVDAVQ